MKPNIWGTRPGCADTIWSNNTPSPGFICSGVGIEPLFFPVTCKGQRWAWQNLHATKSGGLFRPSSSPLGRKPMLAKRNMLRYGRWYNRWCQLINSCCRGDMVMGVAKVCTYSSKRPVQTLFLLSSGVLGMFEKLGWSSSWRLLS